MSCDGTRPEDLAKELAVPGLELRNWLRKRFPRECTGRRREEAMGSHTLSSAVTRSPACQLAGPATCLMASTKGSSSRRISAVNSS